MGERLILCSGCGTKNRIGTGRGQPKCGSCGKPLAVPGFPLFTRPSAVARYAARVLRDAPLIWLFVAGAALVIATLVVFGSISSGKPGQTYVPPVFKDGRIEPGRID